MFLSDAKADSIGIFSSVLCLIHCLLLPILIFAGLLNDDWSIHTEWLDFLFIGFSMIAVFFASRHAQYYLKVFMWLSVSWFSVSILLHEMHTAALYSSMAASIVLVFLHVLNFKRHQENHQTKKESAKARSAA